MSLQEISKRVLACSKCSLRETATAPVPGLGEVGAKYFLIGEAPGREEDAAGIPFVGLSGKRLNELLELAGIDQNDCYITNVVKCRPPQESSNKNRTPRKGEINACKGYLFEELAAVKPETVITLGGTPLSLFCPIGVSKVHGTAMEVEVND